MKEVYRSKVREKFSYPLSFGQTPCIKFGCPKPKSSCPKSVAKSVRHLLF